LDTILSHDSRVEGVVRDARRCRRLPTIKKFEQRFETTNVILLRAPPSIGKTSFSQVYEEYMKERKQSCILVSLLGIPAYEYVTSSNIIIISYLCFISHVSQFSHMIYSEKLSVTERNKEVALFLKDEGLVLDDVMKRNAPMFVIIDECQIIYGTERAPAFWQSIKKLQKLEPGPIRAPYGSGTPIEFEPHQIFNASDFRLVREEFDLIARHYYLTVAAPRIRLPQSVIDMIWLSSGGHAGLARAALRYVRNQNFSAHRSPPPVDEAKMIKELLSTHYSMAMSYTRAFPRMALTDAQQTVVLSALHSAPYSPAPGEAKIVSELIISGYLVRTRHQGRDCVDFAAPIIRKMVHERMHAMPPVGAAINSLSEFIFLVIGGMRTSALVNSHSRAHDLSVTEYMWQAEFYRSGDISYII
jgi:hypothetical protein